MGLGSGAGRPRGWGLMRAAFRSRIVSRFTKGNRGIVGRKIRQYAKLGISRNLRY
jgi:hypothetical protein